MTTYRTFLVQTFAHAMKFTEHEQCCMHNNKLLTQSHVELEKNFDEYATNDWIDNSILAYMIQNESV